MKSVRFFLRFAACLFLLVLGQADGLAREVDQGRLESTVGHLLKEAHYSGRPFDEAMSRRVLGNYIDDLDFDHLYLTQGDIESLVASYGPTLGNEILAGKTEPPLKIFEVYRARVVERIAKVRALLKQPFDFKGARTVETSREHSPWPKDEAEADALWRDRIEGELLDEKLGTHPAGSGAETLEKYCADTLRDLQQETHKETLATFLSALARSYDPHSEYLTKEDLDDLDSDMRLSMVGIGAVLSTEDGFVKVVDLLPGSPAMADGHLKIDDRIVGIAEGQGAFIDVAGMRLDKVLDKIRGKAGTTVRLQVVPSRATDPSQRRVVEIVRRKIRLKDEEARAEIVEPDAEGGKDERLGWITVPSFYGDDDPADSDHARSLTRDVRKLLKRLEMENVRGVVLDLRGDGGGLLAEAVSLSGLFIGKGPIVQVRAADGSVELAKSSDPAVYEGPLVVLTDRLTASAAELFSGALQDYGRAVIVGGERTFGKGTVQAVLDIADYMRGRMRDKGDAGALQLTIAKFYRVAGASNQLQGIVPDVHLPSPEDIPNSGEGAEKYPLPYDAIPPTPFKKTAAQPLFLPELRQRSAARVSASPEFAYLEEDVKRESEALTLNRTSLNEAARRAALAGDKARTLQRATERAERAKHAPGAEKVYLVTLDNVRKPALQLVTGSQLAKARADERKTTAPDDHAARDEEDGASADEAGKAPAVDAVREESFHILDDLIALTHSQKIARAAKHTVP